MKKVNYSVNLFVLLALFITGQIFSQGTNKFTVVLDAGHGGHDSGAVYGKYVEKKIALSVVLKVGEILEKDPSFNVIYTRKSDVFVKLSERANIANKAHANLFVSVHCNAAKSAAYGTETFVMGTTKIASNLEVAKKENEVISLESDYKQTYGGYDPGSIESVIGLTMIQEAYIEQSVSLASVFQTEFTDGLKRNNRGVKQAPFLVLHRTSMPSVLTEIGFVSNAEEGKYLDSEEGQNKIAKAIADGIIKYKKGYAGNESTSIFDKETIDKKDLRMGGDKKFYRIQIASGKNKIELIKENFNGLEDISSLQKGDVYKYYYGHTTDHKEAKKILKEARDAGYKGSFIVSFNPNK